MILAEKGYSIERNALHHLLEAFKASGLSIDDVSGTEYKEQATIDAMRSGVDVISQACLRLVPFKGYADFLVKVPGQQSGQLPL